MTHFSENSRRLKTLSFTPLSEQEAVDHMDNFGDVCFLRLPLPAISEKGMTLSGAARLVERIAWKLKQTATLIVFGEVEDLVHIHPIVSRHLQYQLWAIIRRDTPVHDAQAAALPHQHVSAAIYTRYTGQLRHTKTRLDYTYCPACGKTTKDYGGKKHTYHHQGTLISDVWRDISIDPDGDLSEVIDRFADLFGLPDYSELRVCDVRLLLTRRTKPMPSAFSVQPMERFPLESQLLRGDALEHLQSLPDHCVDFVFADPPYNLQKDYRGYGDDRAIEDYFAWCDQWMSEAARVLRPGGTFAVLNIPLWSIRHFLHLETVLTYQNWLAWDALSFPVRLIMPAHYTILCFTKGKARPLPGLTGGTGDFDLPQTAPVFQALAPLEAGYCLRSQCIAQRKKRGLDDRGALSDLWWDIHRLKHNTRRVDHPCQLPPQLLYRLIMLFTEPGDVVLDCFNGAGTTTLAAHQLGRRYLGIELETAYHQLALARHSEIDQGLDPFRKEERELTAKNSPVARRKKQKYEVPKKTLQLEVRRVAQLLGHLPTRDEMIAYGDYPIRYYDEYFSSWGEVCAAARHAGMKETREEYPETTYSQKRLF
jgi:site-specific DNA-methyltransferase (adenine-specific)